MKESIEKNSSVQARVSVEVPSEKVNEHLNAYFGAIAKRAKIQGYRPGKAPLHVVKKLYGQEGTGEVSQRLVSEALLEVIRKHNLNIILPPTMLAVDDPKENQDFRFEVEIDLKPEVPEIKIEEVEVEVPEDKPIGDARVEEEIKGMLERMAHYHELKEPREIQATDQVLVKYEGSVDGQKVEQASTEKQELTLGSGEVTNDFEKAVLGKKTGDSVEFDVEFPAEHSVEAVKGKTVHFKLDILETREKHIPELDDDLVKKIKPECKNVEEFKATIKKDLEAHHEHQSIRDKRDAMGDGLLAKYDFEVSPRQKQMLAESLARDTVQQLKQMGMPEDELKKRQAEIMGEAAKKAERQIRLTYMLERIGRDNDIKVTDEDIEERLQKTAELTGHSVAEIKEYYSKKEENESSSRMDRLKLDVMDEKSLDYALSKARIKIKGSK